MPVAMSAGLSPVALIRCRGTTGTGTSARLALMNYEGTIKPGDRLETVSLRTMRTNSGYLFDARSPPYQALIDCFLYFFRLQLRYSFCSLKVN